MVSQEYIFELKNELSELKALNRYLNNWGGDIGLPVDSISRINISGSGYQYFNCNHSVDFKNFDYLIEC